MRFGAHVPTCLAYGDPAVLVDLAVTAEEAGWDGFFVWDALALGPGLPVADSQVSLGAIAARTERIRIGPLVSPIARRRPWKVARETASLDLLAPGRTVLGVGLGAPTDFEPFSSELQTPGERAAAVADGIELIQQLLTGEPVRWERSEAGALVVDVHEFLPKPRAPVPIWGAGKISREDSDPQAKGPFTRAAGLNGLFPVPLTDPDRALTPAELRTALGLMFGGAPAPPGFELLTCGQLSAIDGGLYAYAEVGVTWWLESLPVEGSASGARELLEAGPPLMI